MRRSMAWGHAWQVIASAGDTVPRERVAGNREGGGWREEGMREGRLTWAGGVGEWISGTAGRSCGVQEMSARAGKGHGVQGVTGRVSWAMWRYGTDEREVDCVTRSRECCGNRGEGK